MKVVVLGAGSVGYDVSRQLIDEGKDVVLIEKDAERAHYASSHLDCLVVNDFGNDFNVLKAVGMEDADFFIAVTDSDEVNMVSCALAAHYKRPKRIARVRNMNYGRALLDGQPFLGTHYVVSPEIEAVRQIVKTVEHGAVSDILVFEHSNMRVQSITVAKDSPFAGVTPPSARKALKESFLITALLRNEQMIIPRGGTVIKPGDQLFIAAENDAMKRIFKKIRKPVHTINRVVIVGAGTIGRLVTDYLLADGYRVTLIEKEYEKCKEMSAEYPDLLVIHADIKDDTVFEDERLEKNDLLITTTANQEMNILVALYAKSRGVHSTLALVQQANYLHIAGQLGVDATVSPKMSSVDAIMKFIRKGNIRSFYSLFDGKAEIVEFGITREHAVAGMSLKHVGMPETSLIIAISRNGNTVIPEGATVIQPDDDIIVIALRSDVPKIENLFSASR